MLYANVRVRAEERAGRRGWKADGGAFATKRGRVGGGGGGGGVKERIGLFKKRWKWRKARGKKKGVGLRQR